MAGAARVAGMAEVAGAAGIAGRSLFQDVGRPDWRARGVTAAGAPHSIGSVFVFGGSAPGGSALRRLVFGGLLLDGLAGDELGLTRRRTVDFCRVDASLCTRVGA
jgi:hypothetical protein